MTAMNLMIIFVHFLLKTISQNTFTHDLNIFEFFDLFQAKSIMWVIIHRANCLIARGASYD